MKATQEQIRSVLVIGLILLIGLSAGSASSQSSPSYQIERSVLDAGGGDRSSTSYIICDSLGQPSGATVSTSSSYIHWPGFYESGIPTLMVLKTQVEDGNDGLVAPGETISYSLTVKNWFEANIFLMIEDALSSLVTYVSGSPEISENNGVLTYTSGLLEYGAELTIFFDVVVNADAVVGDTIANMATVSAYRPGELTPIIVEDSNIVTAEVIPEPATFALLGIGLFGAFVLLRRRWRRTT